ncbi:MAG: helix-turn-helix domain-containing protein [Lachnospiraceae bacterium]|nr:helix-turn-helix domain-containing protein [Lachnospiraceae bacterium]
MSKKYKDHYLPIEIIIAATQGEAAAIQTVLKTYESYIRNKCIKTVYDERGLAYYGIDTDKKDFMERRLIHAVVENFKINR